MIKRTSALITRLSVFFLVLWFLYALPAGAQQIPKLSLIQVTQPNAAGTVVVTGAPGAVASLAWVDLITLDSGHFRQARAIGDGSFAASTFAPAGASILIKVDENGTTVTPAFNLTPLPATILRVPDPTAASGIGFGGAGPLDARSPPVLPAWIFQGSINSGNFEPGQGLHVEGTLSISSTVLQLPTGTLSTRVALSLERLSGSDGYPRMAQSELSSTLLTPTGLPIERVATTAGPLQEFTANLTRTSSTRAELAMDTTLTLPLDLPEGLYRPYIRLQFTSVPEELVPARSIVATDSIGLLPPNFGSGPQSMYLPVIRVGLAQTPRLAWHLLTDTFSNGTRGVGAIEDRARIGLASRVLTQSDTFIIPRLDPVSGTPLTYRLEPFLPGISAGDRGGPPNPPRIPFRFPSGSLTVRVQYPNGATITLGQAPFVQSRSIGAAGLQPAGNLTDAYQLTTLDSRFEYQFPFDGRYVISMEGSIVDVWGNSWNTSGSYEVYVARQLSLDTAVLPGTPFVQGDVFNTGVVLSPPLPADVRVRFRMSPNSVAAQTTDRTITGVANRFGYFQPAGHGILLDQKGEYRVDITASYTDDQGDLWMGSRTWGSVVASPTPSIVAHGSRGLDDKPAGGPQWFLRTQVGAIGANSHVFFPFNSGDVTWQQQSDSVLPVLRFQDPGGTIVDLMRTRATPSGFTDRAASGETPLVSSRNDGLEPHIDPTRIDLWAYSYRSAQRPLVRVREEISEDGIRSAHWRFDENYGGQISSSPSGDLPNDVKFLYGAAVLRGSALTAPQYAIYGSLFVLVPDADAGGGTRVAPPFQGNGGGPSGGPLLTLKGRNIDLFFHPTAVRPGSVLESGDTFAIAGAVGPAVAATVSTTVTKPGGSTVTFSGRANSVGYYFHPEHDFTADRPGIYTVDITVTFDGRTSAGQVTQPFPRGDVLGTANGRFYVYVVPRGGAPLTVANTDGEILAAPAAVTLSATAPEGMTLQSGHMTSAMPGFMLQAGSLSVTASAISHRHDPVELTRDFPNLDITTPADLVTLTLFGSGVDAQGNPAYAAKVVTLHGAAVMNPAVGRTMGFGIADRGGVSLTSTGGGGTSVTTGYGRIQPSSGGTTPSGIAIFGFRRNGTLVSEAAVPAVAPVLEGRIYAEVSTTVGTGMAIANPNAQTATITFYFTDANGQNFGAGSTTISPNSQIAKFLDQAPFSSGSPMNGTFTFTSDLPVAVVALRGFTNESQSFMMTTLPVSPLSAASGETIYFPQFADGGGWTSQLILVNPTDDVMTGLVTFYDEGSPTAAATPVLVTIDGVNASSFAYSIQPRSSRKLRTTGTGSSVRVGSVRAIPNAGNRTPAGVAVFSYKQAGVTVSESGVPATRAAGAWRLYAEMSGDAAQIQTGVAITNPSTGPVAVSFELTTLTGVSTGLTGALTIPANGHVAVFLNQIPGFATLTTPFRGVLRVSTAVASGIAVTGIRGRVNEANEFLLTTTEPVNESMAPSASDLFFPHIADSGGYTTQFILFSGSAGQTSSGTLRVFKQNGEVLTLPLQ